MDESVPESTEMQNSSCMASEIDSATLESSSSKPAENGNTQRSSLDTEGRNLPTGRQENSLRHGSHHLSYQPHQQLYLEWGEGEDSKNFLDLHMYDYDNDDTSDTCSEFTEDYSRHKKPLLGLPGDVGSNQKGDTDDESSLSSCDISFADEYDEWSSAGSSTDADSRKLHSLNQATSGRGFNNEEDHTGGLHHTFSSSFEGHLLDDPTEFSIEEDPLFNASGTLRLFHVESNLTAEATNAGNRDTWSEEDFESGMNTMSPTESRRSFSPNATSPRVWKETSTGAWVPNSSHVDSNLGDDGILKEAPQESAAVPSSLSYKKQVSSLSMTSQGSVDSFAGERPTPEFRNRKHSQEPSISTKQKDIKSQSTAVEVPAPPPMSPLPPDSKLHIDDSDHDDIDEPGETFSSQEAGRKPATTAVSDTKPMKFPAKVLDSQDSLVLKRLNPIVPSPRPATGKKKATLSNGEFDTLKPSIDANHQEDSRLFLSPIEHVIPLKDHSNKARKARHLAKPLSTAPNEKRKKKKDNKQSHMVDTKPRSNDEERQELNEIEDDDDVSVASECSTDSVDAAIARRTKRNKTASAPASRKAKKSAKKKKKKERAKKRGRRVDFEESSTEEADTHKEGNESPKKSFDVSDRVDAIFKNKQLIFDTVIEEDLYQTIERSEVVPTGVNSENTYSSGKHLLVSSPVSVDLRDSAKAITPQLGETIRVKSKASEESTARESTVSRSRSKSKDPSTTRRSRSKSTDKGASARSRSRSKSKESSPSKRSRSKSKDRRSRSKSKTRSRSKSKERTTSPTIEESKLRRRLKKELTEAAEESENTVDSGNNKPQPSNTAAIFATDDGGAGQGNEDSITTTPNAVSLDDPEKQFSPKRGNSSSETKRRSLRRTKSASNGKRTKGEKVRSPPQTPSRHKMTIQDVIGQEGDSSDDEPLLPSPRASSLGKAEITTLDITMPDYHRPKSDSGAYQETIPVDNTNLVKIQLQRLQNKIFEIALRSKEDIKVLKQQFEQRKQNLTEEIAQERKKDGPLEALLYLQKNVVNELHEEGRAFRKEMKLLQGGISDEIRISTELNCKVIELQRCIASKQLEISRLQLEQAQYSIHLKMYANEYKELQDIARLELRREREVLIGDISDYALIRTACLFRKWEKPSRPRLEENVLADSYRLPRTSIFYNVLADDESKLSFTA